MWMTSEIMGMDSVDDKFAVRIDDSFELRARMSSSEISGFRCGVSSLRLRQFGRHLFERMFWLGTSDKLLLELLSTVHMDFKTEVQNKTYEVFGMNP